MVETIGILGLDSQELNTIGTVGAAIAALAALGVAAMSYYTSKEVERARRIQVAHDLDAAFNGRLNPLYPSLRRVLGDVQDGIPAEVREVIVPFLVLYSDTFKAWRDGLLTDADWTGLGEEFAYWARKPVAREAWDKLRLQVWTDGFVDHVDAALSAESGAYPALEALEDAEAASERK